MVAVLGKRREWVPKKLEPLRDAIANAIAEAVKAYDVPSFVEHQLGLVGGEESEAYKSKRVYVRNRLPNTLQALRDVARLVLEHFEDLQLERALTELENQVAPEITDVTRQKLIRVLSQLETLSGNQDLIEFVESIVPIRRMAPDGSLRAKHSFDADYMWGNASAPRTLADEIIRHCIHNLDWTTEDLLNHIGVKTMSFSRLCELVERTVHPLVRDVSDQRALVEELDNVLQPDGFRIVEVGTQSGHPVFGVRKSNSGVDGKPKNLVFASRGPKPRIIFRDAVNNDIEIVENKDTCLVYDRPLKEEGLLWIDLVEWWQQTSQVESIQDARSQLGQRLLESLQSPPERHLFLQYFHLFHSRMGNKLPALIPQVYLHYDPFTVRELADRKVLNRQRMDFLMLLPFRRRVVLEVDGQQHYSSDGQPRPDFYATMASEDRLLRLTGYEVYRFGATELGEQNAKATTEQFFSALFAKK